MNLNVKVGLASSFGETMAAQIDPNPGNLLAKSGTQIPREQTSKPDPWIGKVLAGVCLSGVDSRGKS